jgi:hypothetical protein
MYCLLFIFWIFKYSEAIAQPYTPSKTVYTKLERLEPIPEPKPVNIPLKPKTLVREAKKDLTAIQKQVQGIAKEHSWGEGEQWEALSWIIQKESSWNPTAQNKTSTAYGLFQWLDGTRKAYNCQKTADVAIQTQCGIKYIKARYGDPIEAKKFHQAKGWY